MRNDRKRGKGKVIMRKQGVEEVEKVEGKRRKRRGGGKEGEESSASHHYCMSVCLLLAWKGR